MLLFAQAQLLPQRLQHRGGVADMAGRAVADLDDVLSLGFKGEVLIEGGNRVGLSLGNADLLCNIRQQFPGKIPELRLNILHNGDQGSGFPHITGENLVRFAVIGFIQHRKVYLLVPIG